MASTNHRLVAATPAPQFEGAILPKPKFKQEMDLPQLLE